jgi:TatD DNase family protein
MLVDSHCHLDRVDLKPYAGDFGRLMADTAAAGVGRMLCVSIDLEHYPAMRALVDPFPQVAVSVGVHPNEDGGRDPSPDELAALAAEAGWRLEQRWISEDPAFAMVLLKA